MLVDSHSMLKRHGSTIFLQALKPSMKEESPTWRAGRFPSQIRLTYVWIGIVSTSLNGIVSLSCHDMEGLTWPKDEK